MFQKSGKAKRWKNGAKSPVLFFVDDLTNRWIDANNNGLLIVEGDYGYYGFNNEGVFNYLNSEILAANANIKTTFFVVTGPMSPMNTDVEILNHSYQMDYTPQSALFFKKVHEDERFELAYHGKTHGSASDNSSDFIQEWEGFHSLDAAIEEIDSGKKIFERTIGVSPPGGKYCGYKSNAFSDESIDKTGFLWWCRFYNRGAVERPDFYASSKTAPDPKSEFSVRLFGKNGVVDIPTTLPGNLLNSVFSYGNGIMRGLKTILKPLFLWWGLRKVRYLLRHGLVISIQEHICPFRGDSVRQTPNIHDDKESLKAIFRYLERKNVWYCTGTELANWINCVNNAD